MGDRTSAGVGGGDPRAQRDARAGRPDWERGRGRRVGACIPDVLRGQVTR